MSHIPLNCPCGKTLKLKSEFAGRKVRCPACQRVIVASVTPEPDLEFTPPPPAEIQLESPNLPGVDFDFSIDETPEVQSTGRASSPELHASIEDEVPPSIDLADEFDLSDDSPEESSNGSRRIFVQVASRPQRQALVTISLLFRTASFILLFGGVCGFLLEVGAIVFFAAKGQIEFTSLLLALGFTLGSLLSTLTVALFLYAGYELLKFVSDLDSRLYEISANIARKHYS